jgi:hypothetical protein
VPGGAGPRRVRRAREVGRTCTVCTHGEHHAINVELVSRESYRQIAQRYGVSNYALKRHSEQHLPQLLLKARDSVERADAEDLLRRVHGFLEDAERIMAKAEEDEQYGVALLAIKRKIESTELEAKLEKLIASAPQVNIALVSHPDWPRFEDTLVGALDPYPAAKYAVAEAIRELDGA